jgi:hypothetical protein
LKSSARRTVDGLLKFREVPGALAYGLSEEAAEAKAYALAPYAIADDVERSKDIPESISILTVSA